MHSNTTGAIGPPPAALIVKDLRSDGHGAADTLGVRSERGRATVADWKRWSCVEVEIDDGIAWVTLNRPEKRNAMNPALNAEMLDVLQAIDAEPQAAVL